MSIAVAPRIYTPEDLLTLPDADRYELVDGQLVERNRGWWSSWIGGRLHFLLSAFCEANPRGWVAPADASYQCFPGAPEKVLKPDVSFIRLERLPDRRLLEAHCRIAPDLAVEVISPNDLYSEIEQKVDEYLRAGVALVWVINPSNHSVRVHRADGSVTDLSEADELDGENVIPGFRCRVRDLFQAAAMPANGS